MELNMLQSKPQQLLIKYMTSLRNAVELRPEDLGAVRMAMSMALNELQDDHRQNLSEMDSIIADLLEQRDQLKAAASTDAAEILRLQTLEDRLTQWVTQHMEITPEANIADVLIEMLDARGTVGRLTTNPAREIAEITAGQMVVATNGHNGGHNGSTSTPPRQDASFRFRGSNDELRTALYASLHTLTERLGHTPSKNDYNRACREFGLPTADGAINRLGRNWGRICEDAGLERNRSFGEKAEDKAENAEAPFRS